MSPAAPVHVYVHVYVPVYAHVCGDPRGGQCRLQYLNSFACSHPCASQRAAAECIVAQVDLRQLLLCLGEGEG